MKMSSFLWIPLVFVLLSSLSAEPYSGAGTSGFSFLKITGSPKAVAMGSTGVAGDATFGINPASYSRASRFFSSSYCYLTVSTHTGSFLYTHPHSLGNFTAGMDYLTSPGIDKTDQQGNVLGKFTYSIIMPRLAFSKDVSENISAGAEIKFLYSSVDEYNAAALAFGAGFIYHFTDIDGLSAGFSVENLGMTLKAYDEEKDPLPLKFSGGVSWSKNIFVLNADFSKASDTRFVLSFGGEVRPYKMMAIRAGYSTKGAEYKTGDSNDILSGFSFGAGFFLSRMSLDYSLVPMKDLGYSHRIGLNFSL